MILARCGRSWQAEAVLDRRLSPDDCAAFERHARGCPICARELRELARLQELGGELPWPEAEPLQRRRERNELLRRAHASSIDPAPASRLGWRPAALIVALAVVALCVAVVALRVDTTPAPPSVPASVATSPRFEVHPHAGSSWHQLSSGASVRLALERGGLRISVGKLHAGQAFLVQLPDGELEVRGTEFLVEADAGRTTRVVVSEGRVALRISGQAELLLGAGQSWQLAALAPASASAPAEPHRPPAPRVAVAPPLVPRASVRASASAQPPGTPHSASDFAAAMEAYARGDFATAERLFERFEQQHPQSSQVQDSLFLRAMARHRRGDQAGAQQLASRYLALYPQGFRVTEARRLAGVQ